jgi:DNA polymerase-1
MNIIRGGIIPSKGHQILELDYSQLEVRIAAAYHQDPTMLKYINDKTTDMHRDMAQQVFKIKKYDKSKTGHGVLRAATKNGFVFPAFYGDYHVGFAESLSSAKWGNLPKHGTWTENDGIPFHKGTLGAHLIKHGIDHLGLPVYKNGNRVSEATGFTKHLRDIERHFWNKRFPVYNQWKEDWYQEYLQKGYFYNKTGFTFQGVMNKKDCINYPVQSSAFHVLLWSLIQATKVMIRERWKTRIIGQIHDAIVLDVHPDELDHVIAVMKCIMENDVKQRFKWINVPLEIEAELCPVDASWNKKEEYKIH